MTGCLQCWWADFNTESATHHIVEEPDYLGMKDPRAAPQMIRVIQLCGAGSPYLQVGGRDCPKFHDFKDMEKRMETLKSQAIETEKKSFKGHTERLRMPESPTLFDLLQVMTEGNDAIYDFVVSAYEVMGGSNPEQFLQMFVDLDDMNIRGKQLEILVAKYDPNSQPGSIYEWLRNKLKTDRPGIFTIVNLEYENSETEEAVLKDAHRLGHRSLEDQ